MNTNNDWQEGTLQFQNSELQIRLEDGSTHVVIESDYVECQQKYNEYADYYLPLHQQFSDGTWYFDSISNVSGRPARFRAALPGERRKNGVLVVEKGKLVIDLWSGEKQEIPSGTSIECNLPQKPEAERTEKEWTKMTWQRVRVEQDGKAWKYIDKFDKSHAIENDTLARITY